MQSPALEIRADLYNRHRHGSMVVRSRSAWTSFALWRPLVLVAGSIGAAALALGAIEIHRGLVRVMVSLNYNDFGKFYYSVEAWKHTGAMYGPTPATSVRLFESTWMQFSNMNPPHFQALILPFTLMPIGVAYAVWVAVNIAAAVVAFRAVIERVGRRPSLWWVLPVLFAAPTLTTTVTGQLSGLSCALVCWIWLDVRAGRWTRAGAIIGVAWSLKLFLAPLVGYLIVRRQWRAAAVSAATGSACFAAGVALFGRVALVDWISALRGVSWEWATMNGSIYAPLVRFTERQALMAHVAPGPPGPSVIVGHLLAAVIVIIGLYLASKDDNVDRSLLLVLTTCLLASPLGWVYYVWILAAPAWACWSDRIVRRAILMALPGWLVPFYLITRFESVPFMLTIGSAYTWSMLILWVGVVFASARRGSTPAKVSRNLALSARRIGIVADSLAPTN